MSGSAAFSPAVSKPAALDRARLFFWLFLLAALNSYMGIAISSAELSGWAATSLNLMGVSAILWVALAAGLRLLHDSGDASPPRRLDWWVAGSVAILTLIPSSSASSAALTLLAGYVIVTSASRSEIRRAAIIFLAITGATMWGRLLLAFFSRPLLDADAFFVGRLAGVAQNGNVLAFADGSGSIAVAPGCSSFQGISLAFVFWATVNQWFDVPASRAAALWCAAAVLATVAINVLRISALAHFPGHFASIHHGFGLQVATWTTMAAVAAICLYGARREVFGRA